MAKRKTLLRYVGIDFGQKRFGVCLSDPLQLTAQVYGTFPANLKQLLKILQQLKTEHGEITVVVGLPKNLRGEDTQSTENVRQFVEQLRAHNQQKPFAIKIEIYDERFSTKASEKTLIEAGVSRQKRKSVIDGMAAAFMLQGYLDKLGTLKAG